MSAGRLPPDTAHAVQEVPLSRGDDPSLTSASVPWMPTSWGEILDRISILGIKSERLEAIRRLAPVRSELQALCAVRDRHLAQDERVVVLSTELDAINRCLWDLEDRLRVLEAAQRFDAEFVESARRVYLTNDRRAAVKNQINALTGSRFLSEKIYGG
jgi:Family of unknown function (DUF6165)